MKYPFVDFDFTFNELNRNIQSFRKNKYFRRMKPLYIVLFSVFVAFTSCNENGKTDKSLLPNSVGNINVLQIITPNDGTVVWAKQSEIILPLQQMVFRRTNPYFQ